MRLFHGCEDFTAGCDVHLLGALGYGEFAAQGRLVILQEINIRCIAREIACHEIECKAAQFLRHERVLVLIVAILVA